MRRVLHRHAMVLVAMAALGACATQPAQQTNVPVDLHALAHWQAHGRIGVSGAAGGGSGSFDWEQHGDRSDVHIRGPVGIGSVRLQVSGDVAAPEVSLLTSDGVTLQSQAAWDELEARLGAPVPAGQLRFWMLGLAAPGEHVWRTSDAGEKTLEQDGWRIEYQQFSRDPGTEVPMRMRATSGETRVRIVVDRWNFGS